MKENVTSLAMREVADAVHELRREVVAGRPAPEERGYVSELARFPALRVALACCRDLAAGEGAVQLVKRVPDRYVDREKRTVRCVCDAVLPFGDLQVCPGACGRLLCADAGGAFAVRFEPEAMAAAAVELAERR